MSVRILLGYARENIILHRNCVQILHSYICKNRVLHRITCNIITEKYAIEQNISQTLKYDKTLI